MLLKIRKANIDDAASIAKVHVDSWKSTYVGILPEAFLQTLTYEPKRWQENIRKQTIYIAEDQSGHIVGFAIGGKERTGNYSEYEGELYAIYLLEEHQGNRIGKRLFQTVVNQLHQERINSMVVCVLAENKAAYFYEAMGGKLIHRTQLNIGGHELPTLVYGWKDIAFYPL